MSPAVLEGFHWIFLDLHQQILCFCICLVFLHVELQLGTFLRSPESHDLESLGLQVLLKSLNQQPSLPSNCCATGCTYPRTPWAPQNCRSLRLNRHESTDGKIGSDWIRLDPDWAGRNNSSAALILAWWTPRRFRRFSIGESIPRAPQTTAEPQVLSKARARCLGVGVQEDLKI